MLPSSGARIGIALERLGHAALDEAGAADGPGAEATPDLVGGLGGPAPAVIRLVEEGQLLTLLEVRSGDAEQSHLDATELGTRQLEGRSEDDLGLVASARAACAGGRR